MKKNIAVVGCGYWGKNLVRNFYELGVLASICDSNLSISNSLSKKYNIKNSFYNEILDDPNIRGIALVVPAQLHAKMAIDAMNKGKHVFVEKPLALNETEAKLMISASKKNSVRLMVGHLLQYHPVFKTIKKVVDANAIGKLNYIYSKRLSYGIIRSNEDVTWSFAPHDVSMILSLAGDVPEFVSSKSTSILQKNIADISSIHMEFKSGLKSDISVSWLNPFKEVKLVIVGKSGMIVFDDTKLWNEKLALYSYKFEISRDVPTLKKFNEDFITVPEIEPLKNECKHFIDVVENNIKPLTNENEGMQVLKVLIAATQSQKDNKTIKI